MLSKRAQGTLLVVAFIFVPIGMLTWIANHSVAYKTALGFVFESRAYESEIGSMKYVILLGQSSSDLTIYPPGGAKRRKCVTYSVLLVASDGHKFADVVIRSDSLDATQWRLVGIAADSEVAPPCKHVPWAKSGVG